MAKISTAFGLVGYDYHGAPKTPGQEHSKDHAGNTGRIENVST